MENESAEAVELVEPSASHNGCNMFDIQPRELHPAFLARDINVKLLTPALHYISESESRLHAFTERENKKLHELEQALGGLRQKANSELYRAMSHLESNGLQYAVQDFKARLERHEEPRQVKTNSASGVPNSPQQKKSSKELLRELETAVKRIETHVEKSILSIVAPKTVLPFDGCTSIVGFLVIWIVFSLIFSGVFGNVFGNLFAIGWPLSLIIILVIRWSTPRNQLESEIQKLLPMFPKIDRYGTVALEAFKQESAVAVEKEMALVLQEHKRLVPVLQAESSKHRTKVNELTRQLGIFSAEWIEERWHLWEPSNLVSFAHRIGIVNLVPMRAPASFQDVSFEFQLPALAPFDDQKALMVDATSRASALAMVQSLLLRILSSLPPGKALFTFIDPVGRGTNVGSLLDLQEYDPRLLGHGICTEQTQINKVLESVTQQMDMVIQKYLRTDFSTLSQYNRSAGEMEEPFRFVVVFDFPTAFNPEASERLVSIARHGAKSGVHLIVMVDPSARAPYGFSWESLKEYSIFIEQGEAPGEFRWNAEGHDGWVLHLDSAPPPDIARRIVKQVGVRAEDNMRVVVPFGKMREMASSDPMHRWRDTLESWHAPWDNAQGKETGQTASGISVPLGLQGARKLQWLEIGDEVPHGLVVGTTGSGKSNLQHVVICGLALKYSPEELELYLIDFKKGVEFKAYAEAKLPHAKVIAIESEREFAFSVIEGLLKEMNDRGNLFRTNDANGLALYRTKTGKTMPRILLLVDEFQGFFKAEDKIATDTRRILENLVREGRAFGIHVILASQSLTGTAQLPASIAGLMELRLVLKCNESDARQLLDDEAPRAKLLTRSGEAIYRAKSQRGLVCERFQTSFLSEDEKIATLKEIHARHEVAVKAGAAAREPLVFEGNEMARLEGCLSIHALLDAAEWPSQAFVELYLGEPIAMRPTLSVRLRRQVGNHLLIVSRDEREGVGMVIASLTSIMAQSAPGRARIIIADLTTVEAEWAEHAELLRDNLGHNITVVDRQRDLAFAIRDLALEVQNRTDGKGGQESVYFVIQGMHRAKALYEDAEPYDGEPASDGPISFAPMSKTKNASAHFSEILRDGPEVGVHVIAWCDTKPALERIAPLRRLLRDFSFRAVTRMNDSDSLAIIDDAAAAKLEKDYRAVLYDENRPGTLPIFRPFSLPPKDWLEHYCQILKNRS